MRPINLPPFAKGFSLRPIKPVLAGVLLLLGVAFWFGWQLLDVRSPVLAFAPDYVSDYAPEEVAESPAENLDNAAAWEEEPAKTTPPFRQAPETAYQEADEFDALDIDYARLEIHPDTAPPAMPEVAAQQATIALTHHDLAAAARHFSALLAREPHHLEARLGLAGIALRQGNLLEARSHYQAALASFPQDARAGAGMVALLAETNETAPELLENRLRHLIAEQPKVAAPYFVLGNLLAEQGRWQEAEAAYFAAFNLEAHNPDYCFNLAVSLDALRQGRLAIEYYRAALAAAKVAPAAFDPAIAQKRLAFLETADEDEAP
jgi:Flp pilus assembly protein TadD